MSKFFAIPPNRLQLTISSGRRGSSELEVKGAVEFEPEAAFHRARLHVVVLGAGGRVLALDDTRLEPIEDAVDHSCLFELSVRMHPQLAADAQSVALWAKGELREQREHGIVSLIDLPAPVQGTTTFHQASGMTFGRGSVESDGDVRFTFHSKCSLAEGGRYAGARMHVTVLDADGGVLFHDDTSIDTEEARNGVVFFEESVSAKSQQLQNADRLEFALMAERHVVSDQISMPWAKITVLRDDD